jgi:hypothetical protein
MSERKNIKRNATRPKVKDKGLVQSMQRNYSKKKKTVVIDDGQFKLL